MKRFFRLFAVALALSGTTAVAADIDSGSNGSWAVGGTWVGGVVPDGNGDTATISGNIVTLDNNRSIGGLALNNTGGTGSLTFNADLTVNGTFTAGTLTVLSGATGNDLTLNGNATVSGDFRFQNNGAVTTSVGNTFNFEGHRASSVVLPTLNLNGTTNFTVGNNLSTASVWTNNGEFNRSGGGNITVTAGAMGGFVNAAGATFTHSDAGTLTLTGGSGFDNDGDIVVSAGTLVLNNYTHNGGTITLSGGELDADMSVDAGGLTGNGDLTGNVTLAAGTSLEASGGTLAIDGDLTLNDTTTVSLTLGAGGLLDFDAIAVSGNADINDADLAVTLDPGTVLNVGDTFEFLTATGGSGTFGTLTFTNPSHPDLAGVIDVASNNYTLRITAVPEPSSMALLGVAAVGAVVRRRRRA